MLRIALPLLLLSCGLFSSPVLAQKAKDKRVEINYVSLPAEKLPDGFNTYSVSVFGANTSIGGFSTTDLENSIKMDGFKRVGTNNSQEFGHLRVSVNTGMVSAGRLAFKTRTDSRKNDKGETIKTTYYWYELPCSGTTSFRILDPEGNILASDSEIYYSNAKSAETTSSSTLTKSADATYNNLRQNYAGDMVRSIVSKAKNVLRDKYDFANAVAEPQFYFVKKHAEEDAFESNLEKTITVFKNLAATTPASEGLKQMEGPIKLWSKYAETAPGKDKDLQEVYIAVNSNLANTYFYLDNIPAAEKHAKRVLAVDEKEKRMERLLDQITKSKGRMAHHDIHTMRYARDLTKAIPPTKVKELEEAKEELAASNHSLPGYIIHNADTIQGMFMREKSEEEFIFGTNGNTKFMVDQDGTLTEKDVTATEVKGFAIGDRKFTRMQFSPCAKGKSEPALHLMEEVYDSDKIKLYKYYPLTGTLSNAQTEYAYMKNGAAAPVSLLDTQFLLWDKGLANYFSDCTDLKDMCAASGFKMNEDDLIKAARVYAEVCE